MTHRLGNLKADDYLLFFVSFLHLLRVIHRREDLLSLWPFPPGLLSSVTVVDEVSGSPEIDILFLCPLQREYGWWPKGRVRVEGEP